MFEDSRIRFGKKRNLSRFPNTFSRILNYWKGLSYGNKSFSILNSLNVECKIIQLLNMEALDMM